MGWIENLRGKTVAMDTSPLIYFIEEHPVYLPVVDPFFEAVERGEFRVITSITTLTEVLVYPIRRRNQKLIKAYKDLLFEAEGLTTVNINQSIATLAAELRADHNLRTPDAIHVATALESSAHFFLTNDIKLSTLSEIKVFVLEKIRTDSYQ